MAEEQGQEMSTIVPVLAEQALQRPFACSCNESAKANCRVCLEEDSINNLSQPCSCAGSMQYVHQECLQTWISEKGSKCCEICQHVYQGNFTYPPTRPAAQTDSFGLLQQLHQHGVTVRADRSTGTITLQRQSPILEDEDSDEARPSGAAWCFTAIMAFMAMLLIRHMFESIDSEQAHQPTGQGQSGGEALGPQSSAGLLLLWLTVRFLVILIPMYAVLRVMHTVRDHQLQQDADQDLEQDLAALLWSLEAGTGQVPAVSRAAEAAVSRAANRALVRAQEREAQLPVIV